MKKTTEKQEIAFESLKGEKLLKNKESPLNVSRGKPPEKQEIAFKKTQGRNS